MLLLLLLLLRSLPLLAVLSRQLLLRLRLQQLLHLRQRRLQPRPRRVQAARLRGRGSTGDRIGSAEAAPAPLEAARPLGGGPSPASQRHLAAPHL